MIGENETCLAMTNSGDRCKRKPLDNGYCSIDAHQAQADEPTQMGNPDVCGHENLHADYDEIEHVTCELPAGHSGNHGMTIKEKPREEAKLVEWDDNAGKPTSEIEPDYTTLPLTNPRHPKHQEAKLAGIVD